MTNGSMDLAFTNVRVGSDALVGNAGDGFRIAMWALDGGRVAIAAQALGVGAAALQEALSHAKTREAFGQPIGNYQAIQWMLADMYPLTPITDLRFSRNRDAAISAIEHFEGRKYNYTPRNQFEEKYANYPAQVVERVRNQVTMAAPHRSTTAPRRSPSSGCWAITRIEYR